MENQTKSYALLEKKVEQIAHLDGLSSLAQWDSAVMLQPGSVHDRSREIATISAISHEMSTNLEMSNLIEATLTEQNFLDENQKTNLTLIKKNYYESTCVSSDMTQEFSIASSESEFAWRKCRAENDFNSLIPYLDRVFKATTNIAEAKSRKLNKPAYDVLVDSFDPDRTVSEINSVYDVLKKELPDLLQKIVEKQSMEKVISLTQIVDENTQKAIGLKIMEKMGFDFSRGRLDKSTHPFCSGNSFDVRITTRYDESNFLSSLFGVIHETGHALYQQNLPRDYKWQHAGAPKGMAFHESQSLIMEMQAATTKHFNEFLAKLLKDEFGFEGPEYSAENLYKLMTRVRPSLIRVDADEVTYPLHVILRFEIEQDIIAGNIKAKDIPAIWNEKMQKYLGVIPPNDTKGCLQDIHWPAGWLGYFPSYTNGAIIASMLMQKIKETYSIDKELSEGSFTSLNNYLNQNLRSIGSLKTSKALLKQSTGYDQIQPLIFVDYLKNKYLD